MTLSQGSEQYSNLLTSIRDNTGGADWSGHRHRYLQESVLNRTLRRMQQEKLVDRHREADFPYRVSYKLTPAAEELVVALVPLAAWAEEHSDLVKEARRHRRRA